MPLTRTQKEELLADYGDGLAKAPHVFLVDYKGISVNEANELRGKLRAAGGSYVVIKNRLALRAIEGAPLEALKGDLSGPTAVAWSDDDPVALAKALSEFAKEVDAFELKSGLVEGQAVAAAEISDIASLPSREELIAKLLFLMQSPVVRLARTLSELRRRFVVVLGQVAAEKE